MKFEVYIPSKEAGSNKAITLTVDAENWMAALKSGLAELGEQGDIAKSIMCDVMDDNSIHVTDTRTARVFRLRELDGAAAPAAAPPVAAPPAAAPVKDENFDYAASKGGIEVGTKDHAASSAQVEKKVAAEADSGESIGRTLSDDDLLAEVFEKFSEIYETGNDIGKAINFVMELCIKKIGAESGAVLVADINADDLYFAAAHGPKADAVMNYRIPMGKGIIGFCSLEGVSLAISDVNKDKRWYSKISDEIGYETKSIIAAPLEYDGRTYGAIELINKNGGSHFTPGEVNALTYIGRSAAEYISQVVDA